MRCLRCQGLMRKDHFLDMEAGFGEMWAYSWRCISCGAIHDAVIENNRMAREPKALLSASVETFEETYLGGEAFIRPAA